MIESVDLVRDGKAPKIDQDPDAGTYESWCRAEQAEIDWSRPVADVYNLIRGCNPQPGAWTLCNGELLQLFDTRRGAETDARPGTVLSVGDKVVEVAAGGGSVEVLRVRPQGRGKIPAGEFANVAGLKPGDRLG